MTWVWHWANLEAFEKDVEDLFMYNLHSLVLEVKACLQCWDSEVKVKTFFWQLSVQSAYACLSLILTEDWQSCQNTLFIDMEKHRRLLATPNFTQASWFLNARILKMKTHLPQSIVWGESKMLFLKMPVRFVWKHISSLAAIFNFRTSSVTEPSAAIFSTITFLTQRTFLSVSF